MSNDAVREHAGAVRRFNRFYTRQIGALREGLSGSTFSLTEARIIYELANRGQNTATALSRSLGLDAGYLSRILRRLHGRGLLRKRTATEDGRRSHLSLTERGHTAFAKLDAAWQQEMETLIGALSGEEQRRLVSAMAVIESLLDPAQEPKVPYILRPHRSGDMGWVVQRHGVLYRDEYGWDERMEGFVAEIVAHFIKHFDPKRERCWIAERDGENVGSVFLVRHPERDGVAKLRLLLVEPKARGLGIGKRLVHECTLFARQAGYRRITLWTNSVLDAARHLYVEEGYQLMAEEQHQSFGHQLVGQNWELEVR